MATSRVRKPTDMSKEDGAAASPVTGKRRREKSKESHGKPAPAQDDDERASLAKKSGAKSKPTKEDGVKPKPATDDAAKPRPAMKQAAKTTPAQDDDEGTKSGKKSRGKPKPAIEKTKPVKPGKENDDAKTTPAQDDDERAKHTKKDCMKSEPAKEEEKTTPAQDDKPPVTTSDDVVKSKPRRAIKYDETDSEEIKVLLWNINGKSIDSKEPSGQDGASRQITVLAEGMNTAARHAMVSEEIKAIMPDVLLLQEITTKIILDEIRRALGGKYEAVSPFREEGFRENISMEAQVLYNTEKFEKEELKVTLLRDAVDDLDKAETEYQVGLREKEKKRGVGRTVRERTSWVCLKRKDGPCAGRRIVFMSFHNYYTSESSKGAKVFCKTVAAMSRRARAPVLAGADFNCDIEETLDEKELKDMILDYKKTERREDKIDFFVTTASPPEIQLRVEARDFTKGTGKKLEGKSIINAKGETYTFTTDEFGTVLDHDPLVCTLTWTTAYRAKSSCTVN